MMSARAIKEMVMSEDVPNSTCVPAPFSSGNYRLSRHEEEASGGATAEEKKTDPATAWMACLLAS